MNTGNYHWSVWQDRYIYVISGQSDPDMEIDSTSRHRFVRIQFQINHVTIVFGKVCKFYLQTGHYQLKCTWIRSGGACQREV